MYFDFDDELKVLQSRARRFVEQELIPHEREVDAGVSGPKVLHAKCSMAELYCAELGHRVADRVVQIFGGRGYCADYAAERLFRDTRADRIWEGTYEIVRSIIASGVMKRDLDHLLG
jgi:alkylation response protein AidB-like acyl-CoA dehydrogenase